ncbi:hypothetical protein [Rhodococcus aetherivorans]|uniref:hypothetical protein n=1 Tax=Rhodococcus aetherivorans TaxID=191292 RepID=UPI001E5F7B5B|nr:hypothetical protein [Rhodococcus aetherivorans]UGQ40868.1 hypothetical protein LRQ66_22430 [Rhodococcus aetherivorans]
MPRGSDMARGGDMARRGDMADLTGPGDGTSGRIRRLTQAALNADVTIARIEGVADGIGVSLANFDRVLGRFDEQLGDFAVAVDRLGASIDRVDLTLRKIERIVDTADWLLTPVTATRRQLTRLPAEILPVLHGPWRDVSGLARTVLRGLGRPGPG